MQKLYPLKFQPVFKDKVWGGTRLKSLLGKDFAPLSNCGESWELCAFAEEVSVVSNGFLKGNELTEVIEIYMGDLVGDKVFDQFGLEFPLLVKFIDTNDYLSVQVHPDDATARKQHNANGKTEMWYIVDAQPGAEIIAGFKQNVNRQTVQKHIENNTLRELLLARPVKAGDVFFLPAGKVHAIGAGITLCEIQQASDVTYRLYDWDRPGLDGKPRELHIEKSLEVLDFKKASEFNLPYQPKPNGSVNLVKDQHFTTNLLNFDHKIESDYFMVDSFVLLVCLEGGFEIHYQGGSEKIGPGEVVLLPAELKQVSYIPFAPSRVLETYIG
ncbi:MAG: class I mannose-6-phosphate isomerase [Bacteroidales bacterium]|nr:class I mannose-6-phosphate isomerase [Bacteroidales bacterium]